MLTGTDLPSVFDNAIREQINQKLQYSIIDGKTGTGKTTTYVGKLVKAGVSATGRNYRVLCILPTKEAVDNSYNRAASNQLNNVNVDFSVGFARDSEVKYTNVKGSTISNIITGYPLPIEDDDTNLVYCTTGHAKNRIEEWLKYLAGEDYISPRSINVFDFVIVDEAHLRSKNMDLDMIIGYLKYLQTAFPKKGVPQIVLTSATYKEENVKIFRIDDIHPFTKVEHYIGLPGDSYEEKMKDLPFGLYQYITESMKNIGGGIILFFLPTIPSINKIKNSLEILDSSNNKFEFFTLHSKVSREDRSNVFKPNTPGKWKLILSTNIAETSLTIPNILIVINFPYENIKIMGANQTVRNQVQLIAKDSFAQRAGRTGRTNNGYVLHLISPSDYEALPDTIKPEIERLPISNELLKVLNCNVDYRFIFGDVNKGSIRELSENQNTRINKTLNELAYFGLVRNCNNHYSVTPRGNFVSDLPLTNKGGILIIKCIENGIDLYPAIVLSAMIESADVLFEGYVPKQFHSNIPFSSILKPWIMFCLKFACISIPGSKIDKLLKFCRDNNINYDVFKDIIKKVTTSIRILRKKGYTVDISIFEPEDCFVKMKDILSTIYFQYRLKKENGRNVYVSTNTKIKHKPIFLSNKFTTYNVFPEFVYAVLNIEKDGTQMILWYPSVYEPSEDFKRGFYVEVQRLEDITEADPVEEEEYDENVENEMMDD